MKSSEWERVAAIVDELLDLGASQREAAIARHCAGDRALESAVRKLMGDVASVESREFLEQPTFHGDALTAGLKGASIGGFELLEVLGEGGMGVVFEARQHKPERRVAVKVLRPAFATKTAMRRFEVEAEILGRMQHPAIASVIASGVHRFEGGGLHFDLPWYAMELLAGARDLGRYAREQNLTLTAKVVLFSRVCDAVHHAHQRGVIHRDLKPGNVLVDARGEPKVIDFGIARTTELQGSQLAERTGGTRAFDLLGTLRYMAPEQVDGRADRVDVRTDVYALGIVLFELLTGRSPLAVDELTLDEAVRAIRLDPPQRPTQVSAELPREFDWIIAECLAKEPAERYQSVAALIVDLDRWQRHEPLSVGPREIRYRIRTFVRRNRVAVAVGAVVVVILVGWVVSLMAALGRARTAEIEASARAIQAQRETEKLRVVRDYFGVAVSQARKTHAGDEVTFAQVVGELERALGSHELAPEIAAVISADVAEFYIGLDQIDRAAELLRRSADQLKTAGLETSFESRKVHSLLARVEQLKGDSRAARESLAKIDAMGPAPEIDRIGVNLVELKTDWERIRQLMAVEQFAAVETKLREMLAPFEQGASDPGHNAQVIRGAISLALASLGRFADAEDFARRTLDDDVAVYGEQSERTANSMTMLAAIRIQRGAPEEALALLERALPILTAKLPVKHRYLLGAREQLALAKQRLGSLDEALAILEQTFLLRAGDEGSWTRDRMLTISRIGRVLVELRRYDEAKQRLRAAFDESLQPLGEDHPSRIAIAGELGRVLVLLGQREEGQPLIASALERTKAMFDSEHPRVRELESWLEGARAGTLVPRSDAGEK